VRGAERPPPRPEAFYAELDDVVISGLPHSQAATPIFSEL